jgi:hypothetical protein
MDHHVDIVRVVLAQLVSPDLVRAEAADGTRTKKENSLLVQVVKKLEYWSNGILEYWFVFPPTTPVLQHSITPFFAYATFDTRSLERSTENSFSNHQCASSLPVANQTPLCDFIYPIISDNIFARPGRLEI